MSGPFKRAGMALTALLTALLLTLGMASAASAHNSEDYDTDAGFSSSIDPNRRAAVCELGETQDGADNAQASDHDSNLLHDDDDGVACNEFGHNTRHPGTGTIDSVDNDSPADAVNVIRDYGLENAPIIVGVIGAIFLVGLTFYLIRRGLMKARGAMRL